MDIKAKTVSELWWLALRNVKDNGYIQNIDRGSFAGEHSRIQYPFLTASIEFPEQDQIPTVPDGVSPPTTEKYITEYFNDYIMGGKLPESNEEYTYASRIGEQLIQVMEMLRETPNTNQASIIVGRPEDLSLGDPACLRLIDFKVVDGKLELTTFWRSHDLWGGLPANLAAMARLLTLVAEYIEKPVGQMHYASSGAHVYSYQLDLLPR